MMRLLLFLCFLIAFLPALGQNHPNTANQPDSAKFFNCFYPENPAEFPGGFEAMVRYLAEKTGNIDLTNKPEGRVILRFTITKTGKIQNIIILKSLDPELDQAAVNAVKGMPIWSPATNNGEVVEEVFTLPVKFSKGIAKVKQKVKRKK